MAPLERIQRIRGLFLQHSTRPKICSLTVTASLAVHRSLHWVVATNLAFSPTDERCSDVTEASATVVDMDAATWVLLHWDSTVTKAGRTYVTARLG